MRTEYVDSFEVPSTGTGRPHYFVFLNYNRSSERAGNNPWLACDSEVVGCFLFSWGIRVHSGCFH